MYMIGPRMPSHQHLGGWRHQNARR